jgi:hypothetical protein
MIMASYSNGLWQLAHREHRSFECSGEVYLQVTATDGQRMCAGPYQAVKVSRGAIYSGDTWLGAHASADESDSSTDCWRHVGLLGAPALGQGGESSSA